MGLASYHQIGMRLGATEVSTITETKVASPFSLEQLRAKGDAIIKARGTMSPYYILAFTPVDSNRDVKSHVEPFDVGTPADVASGIYGSDAEARNAALARFTVLHGAMGPYCYIGVYHTSDDPPRIDDAFLPPKEQAIETRSFTTKQKVAAGLGLGVAAMMIALAAKH